MAQRVNMGIGVIGQPDVVFKRKFRWTFEIQVNDCSGKQVRVPEHFVKSIARPNWTIEETEINFLNGKMWIPGKPTWETATVTYIDVAHDQMRTLWDWMVTVYDFTKPTEAHMGNRRDWNAVGIIYMYDGCGTILEQWELHNLWPTGVNFGDLAYSDSEEATIELTLRYWDVIYKSFCPAFEPKSCCSGCGPSNFSSVGAGVAGGIAGGSIR